MARGRSTTVAVEVVAVVILALLNGPLLLRLPLNGPLPLAPRRGLLPRLLPQTRLHPPRPLRHPRRRLRVPLAPAAPPTPPTLLTRRRPPPAAASPQDRLLPPVLWETITIHRTSFP